MRRSVFLAVVTCGFAYPISAAQDIAAHVTFTTRAARAAVVLPALGKLTGVELKPNADMADEVLIVSVKDVPLTEVLQRIATATSGEWKHVGAGLRLVPDLAVRRREQREEFDRRVTYLKTALAQRIANEKEAQANVVDAGTQAIGNRSALDRMRLAIDYQAGDADIQLEIQRYEDSMITRLIGILDFNELAAAANGERLVYSSHPTRMQHGLSQEATDIVNEFVKAHNDSSEKAKKAVEADLVGMTAKQIEDIHEATKSLNKLGPISRIVLVASVEDQMLIGESPAFKLRLYDAEGNVVVENRATLHVRNAPIARKTPAGTGTVRTPVVYDDMSQRLCEATKDIFAAGIRLQLGTELRRRILHPDRYDPLSFTQTDEILSYAKLMGKPLVADIPDNWSPSFPIVGGLTAPSVEAIRSKIERGDPIAKVSDTEFTVLRPSRPAKARLGRLDRPSLAVLLSRLNDNTVPSLDDMARFAIHNPKPTTGSLSSSYLMNILPNTAMSPWGGTSAWPMLRFYGLLSPDQKSAIEKGGRVGFGSLTPDQRVQIAALVYNSPVRITATVPYQGTHSIQGSDLEDFDRPMIRSDVEPTDVLPNGLAPAGWMAIKIHSEAFASPEQLPGAVTLGPFGILGINDFAERKVGPEHKVDGVAIPSALGRLLVGDRLILDFTIHISAQTVLRERLVNHQIPAGVSPVDEDNLPADLQRLIAQKAAEFKAAESRSNGAKQPPP